MKFITKTILLLLFLTGGVGLTTQVSAEPSHHCMHKGHKVWMASLTEKQQKQIDQLHLDYKKKKYLLKTQLKQAKVEWALLITSDSPKSSDLDKKIDQIAKLKKDKLRLKTEHKIAVRKILDKEQRVAFDSHVLKKSYYGKKYRKRH